jgi:hypothetical protein
MTWFKVDDGLHDHRKVRAAGVPAMGLWLLAGTWSSDNETDGFVPRSVIGRWVGSSGTLPKQLVKAGLWETAEQDGEPGWRFHDWAAWQPTRADLETKRQAAKDRMSRIRNARGSKEVRANVPANEQENFADRSPYPDPTRPDPTRKNYLLTLISRLAAGDARGSEPPPAEVIASWQDIAGPNVNLNAEAAAYFARFGDRPPRDERGAWLGWLSEANRRAAPRPATAPAAPAAPSGGRVVGQDCPEHPGQPAGRCKTCEDAAVPPPPGLRRRNDTDRESA